MENSLVFVWLKGNKPLSKEEKYVEICYDFKEISSPAGRRKDFLILRNHYQFFPDIIFQNLVIFLQTNRV